MSLKLAFMGTPDFAVPTLRALIEAGHDVACVYTQPPRKAGRGMSLRNSPVHDYALSQNIKVRHPVNLKADGDRQDFADLELDAAIVVAYGLILPKIILDAPKFGCFNGHASILPRWRGAAPIQRAIMAGDDTTGVTIMQMDVGLDTGDMTLAQTTPIKSTTTGEELHDTLSQITGELIVKALGELGAGTLTRTIQPTDGITYAAKVSKAEAAVDWTRDAKEIDCHIRGLSPLPGAFCEIAGKRVKLLRSELVVASGDAGSVSDNQLTVCCGTNAVRLTLVQPNGKKPMDAKSFLNGNSLNPGDSVK
jgi:methionyl-tRNA formyltransferase